MRKVGIGVIGCGMIAHTYLENLAKRFGVIKIVGVADLIEEKAKWASERYGAKIMTNEEIYECPEIEIVVNLTNVWSHYEVTRAALEHGKHVYSEKMIAENFDRAKELYDLAEEKGVMFACAPDTFLGGGYQTCRKLIDDGFIGVPFAVNATIIRSYLPSGPAPALNNVLVDGGTIPYDMGGYYIHALQQMFGPVRRVAGFSKNTPKYWSNPANPKYGEKLDIRSSNIVVTSLEFECGVLGTLTAGDIGVMSMAEIPGIWVYGTEGTLFCPDPNTFGGPVKLLKPGAENFVEMPMTHGYHGDERSFNFGGQQEQDFMIRMWEKSRRGVGVADMAWSIVNERPARISNEMGLHTIEILHGADVCTETGKVYEMTTRNPRPVALRAGFMGNDCEAVFDDKWDENIDTTPWWCK